MKHAVHAIAAAACAMQFSLCTQNLSPGLSSNNDGSEITGRVVTANGQGAPNTTVTLISATKADSFSQMTNPAGKYDFTKQRVPYGIYTLQGNRVIDSLAFVVFHLRYDSAGYIPRVDTLFKTGWIYSNIALEDDSNSFGIKMSIPGTSFIAESDAEGNVTITSNVPRGDWPIIYTFIGYKSEYDTAHVSPGMIDTLPSKILERDRSIAIPIANVENLNGRYDTMTSVMQLTWKKITKNINKYEIAIYPDLNFDGEPGYGHFTKDATFADTLFPDDTTDTISIKSRIYQIRVIDTKNNAGQFGEFYPITVARPTVPPAPQCSASVVPQSVTIRLFSTFPQLWWVDSLFIFRTIMNGPPDRIASLTMKPELMYNDTIFIIPQQADSFIPLVYTLYAKSRYDSVSKPSNQASITLFNPKVKYIVQTPGRPLGPDSITPGKYVFVIPSALSLIENDVLQYRLIISDTTMDSALVTPWYTIPDIEAVLDKTGRHAIRCQARSRRFPCLISPVSDTLNIVVYKKHSLAKPQAPFGPADVTDGNTFHYHSDYSSFCSFQHPVAVRYVVSYQGESPSDSTGWLTAPRDTATIIWTKPGMAYLRAQSRCSADNIIVSPWSDALVVTVNK